VAYGSTKSSGNNGRPKILKQNHQIADDGTYAFSFEADDGSYRYETRNIDNLVTGKYGYIDEFGEKKEVEYSSANARSLTLDKNLANIDTIPLKVANLKEEISPITIIQDGKEVELLRFTDGNGVKYVRNVLSRQALNVDDWDTLWVKNTIKGEEGEKGVKGEKGEKGVKGEKGEKGVKGEKGEKGVKGEKGEKGVKGEKGEKGVKGEKGEKGVKGEKGEKGVKGEKGEKGVKGEKGEKGVKGEKGEKGVKGEKGEKGVKGEKGEKGVKGEKGEKGVKGEKGEKGVKGEKGEKGVKGEKGEKGVKGEKGEKGVKGEKGEKGVKGEKGEKGVKGEQGEKGVKGEKGEKGVKGEKGEKGVKGEKGDKGVKGEKGEKGIKGLRASVVTIGSTSICGPIFPITRWFCIVLTASDPSSADTTCTNNAMTLYVASGASVTEKKNEIFMVERALHTDIYSVNYWVGGTWDGSSSYVYSSTTIDTGLLCSEATGFDNTNHFLAIQPTNDVDGTCLKRLTTASHRFVCERSLP